MENKYRLNCLRQLESESIYIFREVAASFKNPVMLYSIGKDSSVLLHLAKKAFAPGKIPFPLLHVDTGFKFREMIEFRDQIVKEEGVRLIVHKNEESAAKKMLPEEAHTEKYIFYKKTKPLLEAISKYGFDAAIGGARREEEKSRAKERVFSLRSGEGSWNPKNQRPELWHIFNTKLAENETMRVFPLSNWTEMDIWQYIKAENIKVVPLYFAKERELVERRGIFFRLDEFVKAKKGEKVIKIMSRYRTLGCSPSTGAIISEAKDLDEIISELSNFKKSERENRAIDLTSEGTMELKKREGYF